MSSSRHVALASGPCNAAGFAARAPRAIAGNRNRVAAVQPASQREVRAREAAFYDARRFGGPQGRSHHVDGRKIDAVTLAEQGAPRATREHDGIGREPSALGPDAAHAACARVEAAHRAVLVHLRAESLRAARDRRRGLGRLRAAIGDRPHAARPLRPSERNSRRQLARAENLAAKTDFARAGEPRFPLRDVGLMLRSVQNAGPAKADVLAQFLAEFPPAPEALHC